MIRRDLTDAVLTLTLDRPAQRNAMSSELVDALIAAVAAVDDDPAVGAVLLVGEGRGFCAGSDLAGLAAMDDAGKRAFEAASGRAARMLIQCGRPVVAAVHGFAVGGGCTLAAAADVVVTTPAAKWSLPEVPIGLFPAWGLDAVAARVGVPAARRLSWGIDTLDGAEAQRIGLADVVAEDAAAEGLAIARRLAALPRGQAAAVKAYFARGLADEAGDLAARGLFMAACGSAEAAASFAKYGGSQTASPRP